MIKQAESLFGSTFDRTDIDQFILASQATQAEALKYFVEHFRSRKPAKTGILWWNMRDMWPQFSDSIVDWFGRKKLAYYFLRNCQRPFCLKMREEPGRLVLTLVNDTLTKAAGKWRVYEPDERRLVREGSFAVGPNTGLDLSVFEIPRDLRLWFLSWDDGSGPFLNHYTAGPSPWDFARYREFLWHIERIPRSRLDEPDIGMTPAQP
jgi:beta-mannosidase